MSQIFVVFWTTDRHTNIEVAAFTDENQANKFKTNYNEEHAKKFKNVKAEFVTESKAQMRTLITRGPNPDPRFPHLGKAIHYHDISSLDLVIWANHYGIHIVPFVVKKYAYEYKNRLEIAMKKYEDSFKKPVYSQQHEGLFDDSDHYYTPNYNYGQPIDGFNHELVTPAIYKEDNMKPFIREVFNKSYVYKGYLFGGNRRSPRRSRSRRRY